MKRKILVNLIIDKYIYEAISQSKISRDLFRKVLKEKSLVDIAQKTSDSLTSLLKKILKIPPKTTIRKYRQSLTEKEIDKFTNQVTAFWCGLAEYLGSMLSKINPKYKDKILWVFNNAQYQWIFFNEKEMKQKK